MEITLDKTDSTEGLIKVKLNEGDYQPGVTEKIKDYSKKASVKGFRPGKVPAGMIRKLYGKSILLDELNRLVSENLNKYIRESDLQFLGEPLPNEEGLESLDLDTQKEFEFKYNVGFAKDFDLAIDKSLEVEKYLVKVDDKVLQETIENLQNQHGETSTPDVSEDNDTLYGVVKHEAAEIEKEISIDIASVTEETKSKLIGLKAEDEVTLDPFKLYEDSHKLHHQLGVSHDDFEALKGDITFTVKSISRKVPAEINQELFDKVYGEGEVNSEDEFKEKVTTSIQQSFSNEGEQYFNVKLRDKLIEQANIVLPDEFLKKWLVQTNDQITDDVLKDEYEYYQKELQWSLIRNKLVKDQEINATTEEVVEEAKAMIRLQFGQAGLIGQMEDQMDSFAQNYLQGENGENYMKIHNQVLNNKVLEYLKSEITINEKEVTIDEFRQLD